MAKDNGAQPLPAKANLRQVLQNGSDNGVGWNMCALNKNTLVDYVNALNSKK